VVLGTQLQLDDTIAALASAPGAAARGIVRISGPEAIACFNTWFEPNDGDRWRATSGATCHAGGLRLAGLRSPLAVLVYAWPNARSYTGQPLIEIHAPGSPPLLEAVLERIFEAGVRPAHPGEFTLRAFLAGRIDLLQAEAVLGVIDAAEEDALGAALRQLAGGISGRMARVRGDLIDLLADLEAGLDFVEDGIEFVSRAEVTRHIHSAAAAIADLVQQCRSRAQSNGRRRVVLAGLPNAGKSTLFNALLVRQAALVSPVAGTTRDYLNETVQWPGVTVELVDTPGWTPTDSEGARKSAPGDESDALTLTSQSLAHEQRQQADLIVWCLPADASEAERLEDRQVRRRELGHVPVLDICTKSDLVGTNSSHQGDPETIHVSALTGKGLSELVERCSQLLTADTTETAEMIVSTAVRCRDSLANCGEAMAGAAAAVESTTGDEIVALEIREALEHLGRVLGTVYTDDILDRIFSRFCIGK
jgi:tRNA modification GTPase